MPTPIAPHIILSQNARTDLQTVARAHSTPPALAFRARIVFRAAALDRPTNLKIGHELGGAHRTVGQWRRRSLDLGLPGLHDAMRSGRPRTMAAPPRVQGISVASTWPQAQDRTVTRWPLDAIVATVLEAVHIDALSRSRIWRLLHDVALTPQKSASWLHSPDEDCDANAHPICQRDAKALASSQHNRVLIGGDEQTGRQVLERNAPTTPAQPGRRERREPADIRHGTRVLIHSLAVATGQRAWTIGSPRTAADCVVHLTQASQRLPRMTREDWVMDHRNTPWSLDVCRVVARWCTGPCEPPKRKKGPQRRAFLSDPSHRHGLHFTPKHGAWLHQAAWFFGVLHRRFVARGSLPSAKVFARSVARFLTDDQARHAHPYRWTSTGEPLVRDTPFSRTRRQQRQGRACLSPRPKRFEQLLYAPRPYRRQAA